MGDPRVARVPVEESGEGLVDARDLDGVLVSAYRADAGGEFGLLRSGVRDRLAEAAAGLPAGVRLLFIEGFRPARLQRRCFEDYRATLVAGDDAELDLLASRFVSPPELAPHTSGAAIDLTLCDEDGRELDLGTRVNATPEESEGACYTKAANISPEASANRAVLNKAMEQAGFVNYPTEWWHWSYGDRYWALTTGAPAAIYGLVEPAFGGGVG